MRAAIVVGNYVNVVDGVALTYNRLVDARLAAGDELMVLGPGSPRPRVGPTGLFVPLPAVPIPVQPEYRLALGIPAAARRALERFEPELIHVSSPDLAGVAALDFARAHGLPAVGAYHSELAAYLRYLPVPGIDWGLGAALERGLWTWIRRFYSRCREVYAPTPALASSLRERGIEAPIRVWPRGVDPERFAPRHRDPQLRAALGVDERRPLILFAARLRWEKGLATLAEVLAALTERGLAHVSAIAGDGPARAALERRCPATQFFGQLDRAALARLYASADLFLYPSATETFGSVTLEAMASGLPTICADAGGTRALVAPGLTGALVEPRSVPAYVDALAPLLGDPGQRQRMGAAARARALDHGWPQALDQLARHWRSLLRADAEPAAL